MAISFHRRSTRTAVTLGFLLLSVLAHAQRLAYLQHQSWSTDSGLPQSSVHQILQSRDGYLWLATEAGVVRYDGVVFRVFSHSSDPAFTSDDVSSLAQDGQNSLWFGTADGLVQHTCGHTRHFGEADGLPSASVVALKVANDGSLVAITTFGAVSYDGLRFQPIDTAKIEAETSFLGSAVAANGPAWMWDQHQVTARRANSTMSWRAGRELPGSRVQVVLVDRRGVTWVGTNRGLVTLGDAGDQVLPMKALGADSILALTEDAEGDLWIGTETSGLHVLRPQAFRSEPSMADDEIRSLVQASDGTIWMGTREDGLRIVHHGAGSMAMRAVPNAALTSPVILSLAAGTHGDIWAGTPDGLNHVEPGGRSKRYTSTNGLPDDLTRSLLAAQDKTLWVGTRGGLAHLHDGRFDTLTETDGLGGNLIGSLFQTSAGDLWVTTLAGLSRLHERQITNFGRAEGLTSNLVTGIVADPTGRLWASSRDQGLFYLSGQRFININPTGMPEEIDGLIADRHGYLWLRSRHGLIRASAKDVAGCATNLKERCRPELQSYGLEDGMPSEELVLNGEPSMLQTVDGELWFATRKGVAITDPAAIQHNSVLPPVVIERFTADADDIVLDGTAGTIPSGHTRYTFEFAGLSFVAPSRVLYRYKLDGLDHDWSTETARRSATYTNLPPGRYTFHVQAANNDGLWNDAGAMIAFRIEPPVYRRWWFLLAALMVTVLIAVLLYRLRLRRLQRSFDAVLAERNRIAREIHDTLAQDFVGVSLQLDLVSQLLAEHSLPEAAQQVKTTRRFVQSGIEEARQSIWNLRANTAAESLPARCTTVAKTFASDTLAVKIRISGPYRPLPLAIEQDVLRVLQEGLSNVQRHAEATTAQVQLVYGDDKLILTVKDDGRGLPATHAGVLEGHFGLQGMRERAEAIAAVLEISSEADRGTALRLVVPIAGKRGVRG